MIKQVNTNKQTNNQTNRKTDRQKDRLKNSGYSQNLHFMDPLNSLTAY